MSCHHSLQLSVLKGLQVVWFLTLLGCFGFGLILIKTSSCSINAVIHWGSTSTSSLMSNINTRGKQPCGAHTIKTHLQQSMRFLMPPIDQHLPNPREKKVVFYTTHLQTNVLAVAIKKENLWLYLIHKNFLGTSTKSFLICWITTTSLVDIYILRPGLHCFCEWVYLAGMTLTGFEIGVVIRGLYKGG